MLLDRRRVKFWQKWVFAFMAIIMAAFLIMIPVNRSLGCGGSSSAADQVNKDITKYKTAVQTNPKNVDAWRSLGESYLLRGNLQTKDSAAQTSDWKASAAAYEKAAKLLAKKKGKAAKQLRVQTLTDLVHVYTYLKDYQQETSIYGQLTALTPNDAEAYLGMGTAAINAGDTNTALLAFTRFLELDPKAPEASAVKQWINENAPSPAPTKGSK